MATNFPDSVDSFTRPLPGNSRVNNPSEPQLWDNMMDALEAVETKLVFDKSAYVESQSWTTDTPPSFFTGVTARSMDWSASTLEDESGLEFAQLDGTGPRTYMILREGLWQHSFYFYYSRNGGGSMLDAELATPFGDMTIDYYEDMDAVLTGDYDSYIDSIFASSFNLRANPAGTYLDMDLVSIVFDIDLFGRSAGAIFYRRVPNLANPTSPIREASLSTVTSRIG